MKELWVYVNLASGEPDSLSEALLVKAQELAENNGFELCAVLVGRNCGSVAESLAMRGVPKVYIGENTSIRACEYTRIADVLQPFVKEQNPEIFLFPASDSASLAASTLAERLKTGCNVHCISADIRDGIFIGTVPAFGGQLMSEILCPTCRPQMATVRLSGGEWSRREPGVVIPFAADVASANSPCLVSVEKDSSGGNSLTDAELVVCCGAGLAAHEGGWELAGKLAERLGGALCCTRNTLDLQCGAEEKDMVGISGSTIAPKVYLGFGVSGAAHHFCGMRDSRLILNVNQDRNNPFFPASDYGYVGDAEEIAIAMLNAL